MNLRVRAKRAPMTPDSTMEVARPTACPVSGLPACQCVHQELWRAGKRRGQVSRRALYTGL
jgi:hypothetical protein